MKKTIFIFTLLVFSLPAGQILGGETKKTIDIEALIAQMTIEEKVGQMTNLTLTTVATENKMAILLDLKKAEDVLVNHHIGSLQNVVNHAYSVSEWHKLINSLQEISVKKTRLKIPFLYCIDAVHGANYTMGSTIFPHNLNLGATRNPDLVKKCSEITAKEVRASGIRYNFSPVLDVGRQPLWPRFVETFGEDVFVVKTMGVASIKGYEGNDLSEPVNVASCMKHYFGYSMPAVGKDRAPAYIPDIMLREYYLPPFIEAVKAGAQTLMVNSGDLNGVPLHASKYWLTEVLRSELEFKGVVISDWEDVKKLHERHRVAASYKEAVRLSVEAGIDLCIVPFNFEFSDYLIELVKEGKISEERINQSVRRVLQLKKNLGLFTRPYVEKEVIKNVGRPEYKETALQAARESLVLLKNENNVLPVSKDKRLLVTGPGAQSLTMLHGAWTYTWQGTKEDYFSQSTSTIITALKKKADVVLFDYKRIIGKKPEDKLPLMPKVDAVVVCIGEDAYAETPGNIKELELDEEQQLLVKELSETGIPIILVLMEGRPRVIREIEPLAQAIIFAGWPGSQGAEAIADVIFGNYNPDGKLSFTYPRYSNELLTYDHKPLDVAVEEVVPEYHYSFKFDPQWAFGHGLSYTSFEYSDLSINSQTLKGEEQVKISVKVKNTGSKAGKETVELYSRDLYASITPPVKRLRAFQKISLQPGEMKTVEFSLNAKDLAFVNEQLQWITEPGEFELIIGPLKKNMNYEL